MLRRREWYGWDGWCLSWEVCELGDVRYLKAGLVTTFGTGIRTQCTYRKLGTSNGNHIDPIAGDATPGTSQQHTRDGRLACAWTLVVRSWPVCASGCVGCEEVAFDLYQPDVTRRSCSRLFKHLIMQQGFHTSTL